MRPGHFSICSFVYVCLACSITAISPFSKTWQPLPVTTWIPIEASLAKGPHAPQSVWSDESHRWSRCSSGAGNDRRRTEVGSLLNDTFPEPDRGGMLIVIAMPLHAFDDAWDLEGNRQYP